MLINNFLLESERDSGGTRLPITRAGGHCEALMPAGRRHPRVSLGAALRGRSERV